MYDMTVLHDYAFGTEYLQIELNGMKRKTNLSSMTIVQYIKFQALITNLSITSSSTILSLLTNVKVPIHDWSLANCELFWETFLF